MIDSDSGFEFSALVVLVHSLSFVVRFLFHALFLSVSGLFYVRVLSHVEYLLLLKFVAIVVVVHRRGLTRIKILQN